MRVIVCIYTARKGYDGTTSRGAPSFPLMREARKLTYWAWILRNSGHDVSLHLLDDAVGAAFQTHDRLREVFGGFPVLHRVQKENCDLYLCTASRLLNEQDRAPRSSKIIASRDTFPNRNDLAWCNKPDVVLGPVWRREDFTNYWERRAKIDDCCYLSAMQVRMLPSPWPPHDDSLAYLESQGLFEAYCTDDVEAIRRRFAVPKVRDLGFVGMPWPWRKETEEALAGPGVEFLWTGSGTDKPQLTGADYFRWVLGCKAILNLPGDTWDSYRFGETAMLGVPMVQDAQRFVWTPPLTDKNSIVIDRWDDKERMLAALDRIESIQEKADVDYKAGWSLRGQLAQACKKAGLEL